MKSVNRSNARQVVRLFGLFCVAVGMKETKTRPSGNGSNKPSANFKSGFGGSLSTSCLPFILRVPAPWDMVPAFQSELSYLHDNVIIKLCFPISSYIFQPRSCLAPPKCPVFHHFKAKFEAVLFVPDWNRRRLGHFTKWHILFGNFVFGMLVGIALWSHFGLRVESAFVLEWTSILFYYVWTTPTVPCHSFPPHISCFLAFFSVSSPRHHPIKSPIQDEQHLMVCRHPFVKAIHLGSGLL